MTEVRCVPLKGNCLFATVAVAAGGVITSEAPLFRSHPDDDAALTARVAAAHAAAPFRFGHDRSHLAALRTLRTAPPPVVRAIAVKAAQTADAGAAEIDAELAAIGATGAAAALDVARRLVLAWEYNAFPTADGALEIYLSASTAAHSCAPNASLEVIEELRRGGSALDASATLRKGDVVDRVAVGLRLRATSAIAPGDEITFCYLPDLDLDLDFRARRAALTEKRWTFVCHCGRCVDEARAFLARPPAPPAVEEEAVAIAPLFGDSSSESGGDT